MYKKNRDLCNIKEDLNSILTNKFSISQSKLLFMGIICEIILNKNIFPKNSMLKEFINNNLLKYLKKQEKYRDYLFKSRTLLIATLQKQIYDNLDYNDILLLVKYLCKILPDDCKDNNKKINRNNSKKDIIDWLEFLSNKDK